ncbi:MAG: glycosyltransferase family 2 protein [Patescibacteria group bacterium]|nr:glycosyltransferase family 2 protein [Patescibacteria group bacterium]
MLLTIQIVNYNSRENLEACLRSIEENVSGQGSIQVVVINNDREKLDIFSGGVKPDIIEKNENIGFGKAHNLGLGTARGKYILFLNPDTKIFPSAVEKLASIFPADEKIGIVGPVHIGGEGAAEEECFGTRKTPLSTIGAKISRAGKQPAAEEIFETDWVSGGAMMIRKDLFSELGGFDENYFMYFEDVDLCLRAKKKGWKVAVHPKAKIFHKSGQSFSDSREKKRYYYNSQDYYIKKNFGPFWAWFVKILRLPYYIKNIWLSR